MTAFAAVGLGGALGAMGRYGISLLPLKSAFPFLTLLTNVLGALVIGFLRNALNLLGLHPYFQNLIVGTIIIVIVAATMYSYNKKMKESKIF